MKKVILFGIGILSIFTLAACGASTASKSKTIPKDLVKVAPADMSEIVSQYDVNGNDYKKCIESKDDINSELTNDGFTVKFQEMSNAQIIDDNTGISDLGKITYSKGDCWIAQGANDDIIKYYSESDGYKASGDYAKKGATIIVTVASENSVASSGASSSSDKSTSSSSSSSTSNSVEKIGSLVKSDADVDFTLTAVTENANVQLEDADTGQTALEVDLTITNHSKDAYDFSPADISVYDSKNNELNLDAVTYSNDFNEIATGITSNVKLYFDNNGNAPYKITDGNIVWSSAS